MHLAWAPLNPRPRRIKKNGRIFSNGLRKRLPRLRKTKKRLRKTKSRPKKRKKRLRKTEKPPK